MARNKGSKILEYAVMVAKFLLGLVLVFLTYGLFIVKNPDQLIWGFIIFIFIVLPTAFVVFFKDRLIVRFPKLLKSWRVFRVFYSVVITLFLVGLASEAYVASANTKTQAVIAYINSQKITLNDVRGRNLPAQQAVKVGQDTVAGLDINKNLIRDDVELAIREKYAKSPRIRSAMLQYAQKLQLELIETFNEETFNAATKEINKAFKCLSDAVVASSYLSAKETVLAIDNKEKEVIDLVLNTDLRKKRHDDLNESYVARYSLYASDECEVSLSSL